MSNEILIVDDVRVNQVVLIKLLNRVGYSTTVAENGYDALRLFKHRQFAAVLMDLQMPYMDGFEATRQMRAHERKQGRRIPIIAVTAFDDRDHRARCLAAGMDAFIAKPIQWTSLLETVEGLIHTMTPSNAFTAGATPGEGKPVPPELHRLFAEVQGDLELVRELSQIFLNVYSSWHDQTPRALDTQDLATVNRKTKELQSSLRSLVLTRSELEGITPQLAEFHNGSIEDAARTYQVVESQISGWIARLKDFLAGNP